jgi:hypothetical protein
MGSALRTASQVYHGLCLLVLHTTYQDKHSIPVRARNTSSEWEAMCLFLYLIPPPLSPSFPTANASSPSHNSTLLPPIAFHPRLRRARRKLGLQALKKEIRYDMQSLLDEMPADEFEKWVESLQKLHNGDREMLVRPELGPSNDDQRQARATPAPVDMRKRAKNAANNAAGTSSLPGRFVENAIIPSNPNTIIKREPGAISSVTTPRSQEDAPARRVVESRAAIRLVSMEERDFRTPVQSVEAASEENPRDVSSIVNADNVSYGTQLQASN